MDTRRFKPCRALESYSVSSMGERAGPGPNGASSSAKEPLLDGDDDNNDSSSSTSSSAASDASSKRSGDGRGSGSSNTTAQLGYVATLRRYGLLLFAACVTLFVSTTLMSAVLPILPKKLESLNAGPHVKGAVFSAFPFAVLFLSPFVPFLCTKLGKIPVLSTGILSEGALEILFGYVEELCGDHRRRLILWVYVVIRLLQGCGEAAITVPMTNLLCERCPSIMGFAIGLQESLAGVGFAVGPMAGGLLYAYGGWHVPFLVLGIATLATFPLVMLALKNYKAPSSEDDDEAGEAAVDENLSGALGENENQELNDGDARESSAPHDRLHMTRPNEALQKNDEAQSIANGVSDALLPRQRRSERTDGTSKGSSQRSSSGSSSTPPYEYSIPPTQLLVNFVTVDAALITIICAIAFGYIEPNIAQHISAELQVDTKEASAMYSLIPLAYSAVSIFGGPLADKVLGYRGMLIAGVVLLIIAHILLGPLPLLNVKEGSMLMWVLQPVSYVLLGIGASASFIPSLPYMQSGVSHLGEAAREAMTGPFNSIYYLGETLGPLIGSYFCEKFPMKVGMTLPAGACSCCLLVSALLMALEKRRKVHKRRKRDIAKKTREQEREHKQAASAGNAPNIFPIGGGATAPAVWQGEMTAASAHQSGMVHDKPE